MSKHSTVSGSVSPLVWLIPLPFLLAMCLPVDLPRSGAQQPGVDRVATAPETALPQGTAASAALRPSR
jgi:hypothetical protein